jgi:hypothetical protein
MPNIAETPKKELKNEHLKKDWLFAKKYFAGKNLTKIIKGKIFFSKAKIISFNTTIEIPENECNGNITQDISYLFYGDKFASVIHKISLESSSNIDKFIKVSS